MKPFFYLNSYFFKKNKLFLLKKKCLNLLINICVTPTLLTTFFVFVS